MKEEDKPHPLGKGVIFIKFSGFSLENLEVPQK